MTDNFTRTGSVGAEVVTQSKVRVMKPKEGVTGGGQAENIRGTFISEDFPRGVSELMSK